MIQVVPNTGIEGRGMAVALAKKPSKIFGVHRLRLCVWHDQHKSFHQEIGELKPDAKIVENVWVTLAETNSLRTFPH